MVTLNNFLAFVYNTSCNHQRNRYIQLVEQHGLSQVDATRHLNDKRMLESCNAQRNAMR